MKKKTVYIILGVLMVLAVLGFVPDNRFDLRLSKQMAIEWVLIAIIALYFLKNKWLKFGVLWLLIRMVITYNKPSYTTFNTMFLGVIFYQMMVAKFEKRHFLALLNAICVIAIINSIVTIFQYFGIWIIMYPNKLLKPAETVHYLGGYLTIVPPGGHPDGFFSGLLTNMNMAGSLCAIALPAFFRKKWVWFIPIILFGLFLSQTLGGVVPACVVIAWFLCRKFNKHKLRISLFFVLMALFYLLVFENIPQILEGNSRFEVWAKSFKVIKVRPIIGWGVGQFRYVFPRIYSFIIKGDQASLKWTYLHNEYLQYLVEVGSIGLFFALGFIGSLIRKGFKYKSELTFLALLGLTAALINAGGNFLFHTSVGVIVFVYAAILERGEKLCGKNGLFYS